VRTVHAEANAIIQAAKNGVAIEGATIYTTASPCWPCFKVIANSGCSRIVFGEFYRDNRIFEYALQIGIELVSLDVPARPDLQPKDTGAPHAVTGPRSSAGPKPAAAAPRAKPAAGRPARRR
jgi:dCMP deaminase